jgi:hypothetical protein
MTKDKSRIQSCIDHINTAIDVDPWAKELVIEMGAEILKQLNNSNQEVKNANDAISRQAAIDALSLGKEILSRVLDDVDVVGTDREKYSFGLGLIEASINDIEELPSIQPVDKDINDSCKDAISRQGAIDHFKSIADATSIGNKYNEGFVDGLNFAVGHLETMPSVQPDIIRCKDCKHKGTKNCVANAWTTILGVTVKDDFYCGLAEKENR